MSSRIPRGRAGRKGQQHRATPGDLRSYAVTPASEVTVTRADGTVEIQPAKPAKKEPPRPRRRGPAVCAMCGGKITGKVRVSRESGPSRGKPVHEECEKKAAAFAPKRRTAKQQAEQRKPDGALSLKEENRRLLAAQDRIRELRRARSQPKAESSGT
ncbi:hypothetical protein AB0C52_24010 [Streptomyces sp. NPDC048717]|uniref:hypothetical protein n=1 Tax=Streptomyces sp. NPDC048717 TaxID=3154928 RepID=UPI00341FDDF0